MFDSYNREINYLRISVTDLCNLRCMYCMPAEGITQKTHSEILSYEQIAQIVSAASDLGITKVRLTGGEPLVRKHIESLVEMIASIEKISFLGMTTNGTLLDKKAESLKHAGLSRINISLDTLDKDRYAHITRGGNIQSVLNGIDAAVKQNFILKLNMVVFPDTTREEIDTMKQFAAARNMTLQLINQFTLAREKRDGYTFDRPYDCKDCNRLRLLAHGVFKPCLHSNDEIPVDMGNISESIKRAVSLKPLHGKACLQIVSCQRLEADDGIFAP